MKMLMMRLQRGFVLSLLSASFAAANAGPGDDDERVGGIRQPGNVLPVATSATEISGEQTDPVIVLYLTNKGAILYDLSAFPPVVRGDERWPKPITLFMLHHPLETVRRWREGFDARLQEEPSPLLVEFRIHKDAPWLHVQHVLRLEDFA